MPESNERSEYLLFAGMLRGSEYYAINALFKLVVTLGRLALRENSSARMEWEHAIDEAQEYVKAGALEVSKRNQW